MYRWHRAHIPTFCAGCILYDFSADSPKQFEQAIHSALDSMLMESETVAMLNCPVDYFGPYSTRNVMQWFRDKEGESINVSGTIVRIAKVTETEPWRNKNSGVMVTSMLVHIEYEEESEDDGGWDEDDEEY